MHMKKGAFTNSSTGYGGHSKHCSGRNKSTLASSASELSDKNNRDNYQKGNKDIAIDDLDKDLNSGFGNYIRSDEGVEMMKLFVFANTIVMILTMAWPHLREQYYWLREWIESFSEASIN